MKSILFWTLSSLRNNLLQCTNSETFVRCFFIRSISSLFIKLTLVITQLIIGYLFLSSYCILRLNSFTYTIPVLKFTTKHLSISPAICSKTMLHVAEITALIDIAIWRFPYSISLHKPSPKFSLVVGLIFPDILALALEPTLLIVTNIYISIYKHFLAKSLLFTHGKTALVFALFADQHTFPIIEIVLPLALILLSVTVVDCSIFIFHISTELSTIYIAVWHNLNPLPLLLQHLLKILTRTLP